MTQSLTEVIKITAQTGSFIPFITCCSTVLPQPVKSKLLDISGKSSRKSTDRVLIDKYFVVANGNLMFLNANVSGSQAGQKEALKGPTAKEGEVSITTDRSITA